MVKECLYLLQCIHSLFAILNFFDDFNKLFIKFFFIVLGYQTDFEIELDMLKEHANDISQMRFNFVLFLINNSSDRLAVKLAFVKPIMLGV
jgi:hypothetical protein